MCDEYAKDTVEVEDGKGGDSFMSPEADRDVGRPIVERVVEDARCAPPSCDSEVLRR